MKDRRADSQAWGFITLFLLIIIISGCEGQNGKPEGTVKSGTPGPPRNLDYSTVSAMATDMKAFATAIQSREEKTLQEVNDRYAGTLFQLELKPLLYNVYPATTGNQVVFVIYPKDPKTGSDYHLQFDKKIPAADSDTIEIQIRDKDPNVPLHCEMTLPDPKSYVKEYETHDIVGRYTLSKQFLQSGTYDFDALLYPSYRIHGYPFIVMDLVKAELIDRTVNATTACRQ